MPAQKPGRSKQAVRTPDDFFRAASERLGPFWIDLAATYRNRLRPLYYDRKQNALVQSWLYPVGRPRYSTDTDWAWCNPPFADIAPWARKGLIEAQGGAHIAMLLPAAVGSNWWKQYVHHQAKVLLLNGRLTFKGHRTCYPKDLVLVLFSPSVAFDYEVWTWRDSPAVAEHRHIRRVPIRRRLSR
jgi:phage N-6-adenine-methyltransferase